MNERKEREYGLPRRLLDLVYPPRCILCHELLSHGERILCQSCGRTMPVTDDVHCKNYGLAFDTCLSPFHYEAHLRESIRRFKFQGQWQYSEVYARWMVDCLNRRCPDWRTHFDCVTWIPLHPKRLRKRGYDQSKLLARQVAKQMHLPLVSTLRKCRNTPAQSGTARAEDRWKNIEGAYQVRSEERVRGKRLLLVDDIYTTGSTMEEASKMLHQAGAQEICAITLACGARNVQKDGKQETG